MRDNGIEDKVGIAKVKNARRQPEIFTVGRDITEVGKRQEKSSCDRSRHTDSFGDLTQSEGIGWSDPMRERRALFPLRSGEGTNDFDSARQRSHIVFCILHGEK